MGQMELNAAKERLMSSFQEVKQELIRRQMDELQAVLKSESLSPSEMNEVEAWNMGLISMLEDLPSEGQGWILRLGPSLQTLPCSPVPFVTHGRRIQIMGDIDKIIVPLDAGPGKDWPLPNSTAIDPGEGGDWDIRRNYNLGRPLVHRPLPSDDSGEGSDHEIKNDYGSGDLALNRPIPDPGEGGDWGGRDSLMQAGRWMQAGQDLDGRIIGFIIDRSKRR